jgi:small conductance mechanosensitive channel
MKEHAETILQYNYWQSILHSASQWAVRVLPGIILILVLTFIGIFLLRFAQRALKKVLLKKGREDIPHSEREQQAITLSNVLGKAGKVAILTIAFIMLLKEAGVEVGPLIAGAGIAGVAIGFGAQNLIKDVIAGFFLLSEGKIRLGDVISIEGKSGVVEEISLRTIVLRNLDGVIHVIPHGMVGTISNMTTKWSAALIDVGIAYNEDVDRVIEVMKDAGTQLMSDPSFEDKIIEPVEIFGIDSFGESSIILKARIKTLPMHQWAVAREYRKRLKKAFDEKGIEIPYPHRKLFIQDLRSSHIS